jgi:hypothetical protein
MSRRRLGLKREEKQFCRMEVACAFCQGSSKCKCKCLQVEEGDAERDARAPQGSKDLNMQAMYVYMYPLRWRVGDQSLPLRCDALVIQ